MTVRGDAGRIVHRLLGKVVLLAASLAFAFAAAEVVLRVAVPVREPRHRAIDQNAADLPVLVTMWDLLKPNLRGQLDGALYVFNRDSMRGPDLDVVKPAGIFRVAVIGDSFTNGQGVRYEDAYPFLVSQALNAAGDSRRYEVLNLGIPGFNLRASIDRLRKIGLKYDPDLFIYGWTVNDIEGPNYRGMALKCSDIGPAWRTPSRVVNLVGSQSDYLLDLFWHLPGSYPWALDDNYFRNPAAWAFWKKDLTEFAAIGRERGNCVVMLQHTNLLALHGLHTFRAYVVAAAAAAKAAKIPVAGSLPYHFGHRPEDLWVDDYNRHPNQEGHRIVARALLDGLATLPQSCWKGPPPAALRR